ncbi:MAG: flagellar motor switch protein FliN [Nitrospirota bacterium]|nr:flagellar motor switch protein FliN [Nitrospirota bacterium]
MADDPGAPEEEDDMARAMAEAMAEAGQTIEKEMPGAAPAPPSDAEQAAIDDAMAAAAADVAPVAEEKPMPDAEPAPLSTLAPQQTGEPLGNLDFILDVPLQITVTLGGTRMLIKELLQLGQGSVVELEKMAGEPMDVLIGDKLVARGEVVVVNEKFGVRLTDIVSTVDRIQNLNGK